MSAHFDGAARLRPLHWVALAVILVLAAALRFWSAAATEVRDPIRGDAVDYVGYAYNTETFGVYSRQPTWLTRDIVPPQADVLRPPAYPMFLALHLSGAPDDGFVRRVMRSQAALGVLLVLPAFAAARRALGASPALAVALFVALSPHLISHEAVLLSETLFAVAVALCVAAFCRLEAARVDALPSAIGWGAALGAAFAFAALVRPTLMHLPILLFVLAMLVPAGRRAWKPVTAMLLVFALLIGAWKAWAELHAGGAGEDGLALGSLLHGAYPDFMYEGRSDTYGYAYSFDPRLGAAQQSADTALAYLRERFAASPGEMWRWYLLGKPLALFGWDMVGGWREVFTFPLASSPMLDQPVIRGVIAAMRAVHWPLVGLAIVGSVFALRGRALPGMSPSQVTLLRWLVVLMAFVVAVHIVASPYPRYSIPFRPVLYLLSVFGALHVGRFLVRT